MGLFTKQGKTVNRVVLLPIESILPNPAQPRKMFELGDLECLAESIYENGILQPLTVRMLEPEKYELISGERRLKAAKIARLTEVPCIIIETDSKQSAIFALIENIQRQDLNFFEEAAAIQNLIVEWGVTQEEAAKRLGKAQSTIANKLRLLKLDSCQQKAILDSGLSERHARALLRLPDSQSIDKAIHYIVGRRLNVKQTEKYIEDFLKQEVKPAHTLIPVIKDVRILFNTINRAVDTMKRCGIDATTERVDKENSIEYIVHIPL